MAHFYFYIQPTNFAFPIHYQFALSLNLGNHFVILHRYIPFEIFNISQFVSGIIISIFDEEALCNSDRVAVLIVFHYNWGRRPQ